MRKLAGIFILVCITGPFIGTFGFLQYEKWMVRKTIKRCMIAGIDASELVLLEFSAEESLTLLDWKHSKEFEYAGEMYDIVYRTERTDSVFYHCWHDHAETSLNRQLDILLAMALGADPGNEREREQEHILQFMKVFYAGTADQKPTPAFPPVQMLSPRDENPHPLFKQSPQVPPPQFT